MSSINFSEKSVSSSGDEGIKFGKEDKNEGASFGEHLKKIEKLAYGKKLTKSKNFLAYNNGFTYTKDSTQKVSKKFLNAYMLATVNYFEELLEANNGSKIPLRIFQAKSHALHSYSDRELIRFTQAFRQIFYLKPRDTPFSNMCLNFIDGDIRDRMQTLYFRALLEDEFSENLPEINFLTIEENKLNKIQTFYNKRLCCEVESPKYFKYKSFIAKILEGKDREIQKSITFTKSQTFVFKRYDLPDVSKARGKENVKPENLLTEQVRKLTMEEVELNYFRKNFSKILSKSIIEFKKFLTAEMNTTLKETIIEKVYKQEIFGLPHLYREVLEEISIHFEEYTQKLEAYKKYLDAVVNSEKVEEMEPPVRPNLQHIVTLVKEKFKAKLQAKYLVPINVWNEDKECFEVKLRHEPYVRKPIEDIVVRLLNLDGKSSDSLINQLIFPFMRIK